MDIAFVSTTFDNSGIGTYSREVYEELRRQGARVTKVHLDYGNRRIAIGMGDDARAIEKRRIPSEPELLFHLRCRTDIPDGFDIYHIAHPGISFLDVQPKVVTCHDLIKYLFPRAYTEYLTRGLMYRPLKMADRVITISQSTKVDLRRILGLDEKNITTVYNGVANRYRPIENITDAELPTKDIPDDEKILLYVGSEEPRKNVPVLLRAFAGVHNADESTHLVKVGSPSKFGSRKRTRRLITALGIDDAVTIIESVPERSLPYLYNRADVFVSASSYEGFGLPVVEALACGTPVIAANASSLPELVGDAGILCEPESVTEFEEAILRLLSDERLCDAFGEAGRRRAVEFTWENSVEATVEVYRSAIRDRRRVRQSVQ